MTETIELVRRPVSMRDDYWALLRMQQFSYELNFGDGVFSDEAFRVSLRAAQSHDQVYAYEWDNQLVGWLWLAVDNTLALAHIRHVQIDKPYWGRGFGKALIRDAIEVSIDSGCVELTLNVTKSNARAMALYAGQGFELIRDNGKRQKMRLWLGTRQPVIR